MRGRGEGEIERNTGIRRTAIQNRYKDLEDEVPLLVGRKKMPHVLQCAIVLVFLLKFKPLLDRALFLWYTMLKASG